MEVLANTEYQDLYRIKGGVLLVVNKFENMYPEQAIRIHDKSPEKKYGKGTQKWLNVLKEDHTYAPYNFHTGEYNEPITIPKGTVTCLGKPVIPVRDRSKWRYEVKTTGECFCGDLEQITELLNTIRGIIEKENEQELDIDYEN